jgi:uncharacterized repeat protein (TIGR01451 family)
MTKIYGSTFQVGSIGTYTLTVTNLGPRATNAPITVTDPLPAALGLVSVEGAGWSCSASGQTISCVTSDSLAVQRGSAITLRVNVSQAAYPSVTNTSRLDYAGDIDPSNNVGNRPTTVRQGSTTPLPTATPTRAPFRTPSPTMTPTPVSGNAAVTDLLLKANTTGLFAVGQQGSYAIRVTNLGPRTTNDTMTVTDPLPNGLTFISASGDGWVCNAAGALVTCTNANPLPVQATTSITLTVGVGSAAAPTVTNVLNLAYRGDDNLSNNTAHVPTTVRQ